MTQKIALITGANKGIGYETARGLGAYGVTVLVGARSAERGESAVKALAADGIDARFLAIDVTDPQTAAAAAARIDEELGRLDILVNNAGIARADGNWNTSELTLETTRAVLEVNLVGVISVTNAMVPLLRRAPAARIVNVTSEIGSMTVMLDPTGPFWQLQGGVYGASKAALNMLTVSYAKEFWETPIKVNAVSPGYCATDFNGHSGYRTAAQGAQPIVRAALLDADGPTGAFLNDEEEFRVGDVVPW